MTHFYVYKLFDICLFCKCYEIARSVFKSPSVAVKGMWSNKLNMMSTAKIIMLKVLQN